MEEIRKELNELIRLFQLPNILTDLFRQAVTNGQDGFLYQWIEAGKQNTIIVSIKRTEENLYE